MPWNRRLPRGTRRRIVISQLENTDAVRILRARTEIVRGISFRDSFCIGVIGLAPAISAACCRVLNPDRTNYSARLILFHNGVFGLAPAIVDQGD